MARIAVGCGIGARTGVGLVKHLSIVNYVYVWQLIVLDKECFPLSCCTAMVIVVDILCLLETNFKIVLLSISINLKFFLITVLNMNGY